MATKAAGKKSGKSRKHVYFFGGGKADGNRNMKDLLGGKGSGLAEMTNAGLPVPPGFTISTEVCNIYYRERSKIPGAIDREIAEHLKRIDGTSGAQAILNAHYTGTFALLSYSFPLRFFTRLGATEIDPDTICNKAGHVALEYVYGTSLVGFDPATARDAECILVWGANPSASAPHAHDHWLPESPGRVIVVDPVRTPTAEAADLHL